LTWSKEQQRTSGLQGFAKQLAHMVAYSKNLLHTMLPAIGCNQHKMITRWHPAASPVHGQGIGPGLQLGGCVAQLRQGLVLRGCQAQHHQAIILRQQERVQIW
jgi:hypothetical protein